MPNRRKDEDDDWLTPLVISFARFTGVVLVALGGGIFSIFRLRKQRQENAYRADLLAPPTNLPKAKRATQPAQQIVTQSNSKPSPSRTAFKITLAENLAMLGGLLLCMAGFQAISPQLDTTANFVISLSIVATIWILYRWSSSAFVPMPPRIITVVRPPLPANAEVVVTPTPPSVVAQPENDMPDSLTVVDSATQTVVPAISVPETRPTEYIIRLPKTTAWEPRRALQWMEQLLYTFDLLNFQIVATAQGITWQVMDLTGRDNDMMAQALRAQFPAAEIECRALDRTAEKAPFYRYVALYRQTNEFVRPLNYVTDLKTPDPLDALTQLMNTLQVGERIVYSLMVIGYNEGAYSEGLRMVTQSTIHPLQFLTMSGIADAAYKKLSQQELVEKWVPELQRVFEEKLGQRLYQAFFCIQLDSPVKERITALSMVNSVTEQFTHYPFNALRQVATPNADVLYVDSVEQDRDTDALGRFLAVAMRPEYEALRYATRLILEPRELATLWHLPHEGCTASRIAWISGTVAPVSAPIAEGANGVVLGTARYQGKSVAVKLPAADRTLHTNIVGKSGMGKSTLMHHLIHQDIANGEGVAVIDPHGTLVRDILRMSIPDHREADVVVLDLANTAYPPPLNPLRGHASRVGQGKVLSIIEKLFIGTDQLARLSKYLRASLGLLQADTTATMRDITRVFIDSAYRHRLLDEVDDPLTQDVWDGYEILSPGQQEQLRDPIVSRIAPFYGNPVIYPMLCHPDALDFGSLIRQRKILLISLKMDETQVPEQERDLLGALMISLLQLSGMEQSEHPFYIYVDEVQRFVTSSLPALLSEARKFGLALTVAHQFLEQLQGETLKAVLGTVSTTIAFRCGVNDARVLSPYMSPHFRAEQLASLDQFQAAVSLQHLGAKQEAFTLWTDKPLTVTDESAAREREVALREASRQRYTPRTAEEVKTWLKQRYPRLKRKSAGGGDDADDFYGA